MSLRRAAVAAGAAVKAGIGAPYRGPRALTGGKVSSNVPFGADAPIMGELSRGVIGRTTSTAKHYATTLDESSIAEFTKEGA
jgi:hypothetical protein